MSDGGEKIVERKSSILSTYFPFLHSRLIHFGLLKYCVWVAEGEGGIRTFSDNSLVQKEGIFTIEILRK